MPGTNAVDVHHRLDGAGSVNAGKVVIREREEFFGGSRRNDDALRFYFFVDAVVVDRDDTVFIETNRRRVFPDGRAVAEGVKSVAEHRRDVDASYRGVLLLRSEKLVCLFDELAAEMSVALEEQNFRTGFCRRIGSHKSGGSTADDDEINFIHHQVPLDPIASQRPCRAVKAPCMCVRSIFH